MYVKEEKAKDYADRIPHYKDKKQKIDFGKWK